MTYPFVDEAIGRDPQVARNLHMGDYTNLSVNLDIDLADLNLPVDPPAMRSQVCAAGQGCAASRSATPSTRSQG